MTVGELEALLAQIKDKDIEVVVRCAWEDETPNGNCFAAKGMTEDYSHGEKPQHFAALDCDQEIELE